MKLGLLIGLGLWILIAVAFNAAFAGGYGGDTNNVTNNYYESSSVSNVSTGVSQNDLDESTSKALSCDHSFYMGTRRWMGSVQGAVFRGESSLCLGLAKVVGQDNDVMVNFSLVPDDEDDVEDWGYQGGVLFLF